MKGKTKEHGARSRGGWRASSPPRAASLTTILATLGILLTGGFPIGAQTPAGASAQAPSDGAPSLFLGLDSRLWIEGTSTVRDFTCEAGVVAATLRPGPVAAPLAVENLDQALRQAGVQIPGAQLDCSNDTMNDHMWNALKVEDHPNIRFHFEDYRVTGPSGDTATVQLPGELTMAGVTRPLTVSARAIPQADGSLRVTGSSELDMTAWSVKPPSLMFGMMKVGERVQVHFDLLVRSQQDMSD